MLHALHDKCKRPSGTCVLIMKFPFLVIGHGNFERDIFQVALSIFSKKKKKKRKKESGFIKLLQVTSYDHLPFLSALNLKLMSSQLDCTTPTLFASFANIKIFIRKDN